MDEVANDNGKTCLDVLDHFLQDMHDLDMQESMTKVDQTNTNSTNIETKRELKVGLKPGKSRNQSWLRRKEELARLRLQTAEMENYVAFLKFFQTEQHLPAEVTKSVYAWKVAAEKEKKRQETAQQQNQALKNQLRAYVELSNNLQRAMSSDSFQMQAANVMMSTSVLDVDMRLLRQLRITSPTTFNMLERRLDQRIHDVRVIFNELKQASISMSSCDTRMLQEEGNFRVMEYRCGHVLPFDEELTLNAAWSIVGVGGIPQKQLSQVRKRSENTYWIDARFVNRSGSDGTVTIDTHIVIKRFLVPGGCVILAESSSEWLACRGNVDVWNATSKESLWGAVGGYSEETTVSQHAAPLRSPACKIKALLRSEQQNSQPVTSSTMPEFVMQSFQELVDSHRQFLENALLDSVRVAEN